MQVDVTRTYLELTSRDAHRAPGRPLPKGLRLVRHDAGDVARYRAAYRLVGAQWHWRDRNAWTDERLAAHLRNPSVAVWELVSGSETAGYVELERRDDGSVEIMYFGLAPAWMNRGVGGPFLSCAIELAWESGANRVTLNTCTLDSPRALPNYLARGFTVSRTEQYQATLPEE